MKQTHIVAPQHRALLALKNSSRAQHSLVLNSAISAACQAGTAKPRPMLWGALVLALRDRTPPVLLYFQYTCLLQGYVLLKTESTVLPAQQIKMLCNMVCAAY